jgi:hypothetical protein
VKKGLIGEKPRAMAFHVGRYPTVVFYDPAIENEYGEPLPRTAEQREREERQRRHRILAKRSYRPGARSR